MQMLFSHLWAAVGDGWTILFTAIRVTVVYVVLLGVLRWMGRRLLGQMTPFDLVTLLLLSNAVQNAMIGPDNSLVGGLLGALILLVWNRVISRRTKLRRFFEGAPVVLITRGRVVEEHLRREGIDLEELLAALREHGVDRIDAVDAAVLEMDGTISVIPQSSPTIHRLRKVRSSRNR
ncbi:YetF domain-containing protein [Kyrpidia sp.]|uniref:DUF421 domain-containing protein n=1 Tax=Kyrpidia sp. TaxID=2073077 RepID=UPI002588BD27|nr:YetF domain-containing protein [Kyrpidia sp.]